MRRHTGWILAFTAGFFVSRCVDFSSFDGSPPEVSAQAKPGPVLRCEGREPGNRSGYREGDVTGDGELNLTDAVALLNHLFSGAPPPTTRGEFPVKTLIFTRHAEKKGSGSNAPLSPEGWERARVFGKMLETVDIDFFIASERDRTIDTLLPTAENHGKTREDIEQIPEICDVVDRVDRMPHGSTAVIAHHSFTLHQILDELEVPDHADIRMSGSEYDNWLVVEIPVDSTPELLHFKYPDIPEPSDKGGDGGGAGVKLRRR